MNIQRKEFTYTHSHLFSKKTAIKEVQDFVDSIGKERLVNICEYVANIDGNDSTCWAIWYWDE